MKKILICLFLLAAISLTYAYADEDPVLVYVAELVQENVNLSGKPLNAYLSISKDSIKNPNQFSIDFDWRDGDESIRVLCYRTARVYTLYPVDTLEKIHCFLFMLNHYEEIKIMLPSSTDLTINIWEPDGNKISITDVNYRSYLNRCRAMLEFE